jgi:hypothetical protein
MKATTIIGLILVLVIGAVGGYVISRHWTRGVGTWDGITEGSPLHITSDGNKVATGACDLIVHIRLYSSAADQEQAISNVRDYLSGSATVSYNSLRGALIGNGFGPLLAFDGTSEAALLDDPISRAAWNINAGSDHSDSKGGCYSGDLVYVDFIYRKHLSLSADTTACYIQDVDAYLAKTLGPKPIPSPMPIPTVPRSADPDIGKKCLEQNGDFDKAAQDILQIVVPTPLSPH